MKNPLREMSQIVKSVFVEARGNQERTQQTAFRAVRNGCVEIVRLECRKISGF